MNNIESKQKGNVIRPLRNLLLILPLLISSGLTAQIKSKKIVPFDLDKRTIGEMPFDERFEFSGFDTKYDEIIFLYGINGAYKDRKPNYNKGGVMKLAIDGVTGKAIFPDYVGPLHPNVPYDFIFQVSKEIELSTSEEEALQEEIYGLIESQFNLVTEIDPEKIESFKIQLQALLVKYAKTDRIVDRVGNEIDVRTAPLYSSQLQPVLSNILFDYYKINTDFSETNNQIQIAQDNAFESFIKSDSFKEVFDDIATVLKNPNTVSDGFKSTLDAPISPIKGPNEKLTLRQYLQFIIVDPDALLSEIILGKAKIAGDDHQEVENLDLNSLKIISKSLEKLARESNTKKNGTSFFSSEQIRFIKYSKTKVDDVIIALSTLEKTREDIDKAKRKIPNLLKNAIAKKDIKISESVEIDVLAEKNAYIGLDAGLGFAFGNANGLFTYYGANFYFRPVNHQTKFSDLQGWDEFFKRFSIYIGLAHIVTDEEERYEALLDNNSLLIGSGYRLTRGFRLNIGGLLHYKKDINPIIDNRKITVSPTVSLSIDINLVKALGAVGEALNLD